MVEGCKLVAHRHVKAQNDTYNRYTTTCEDEKNIKRFVSKSQSRCESVAKGFGEKRRETVADI
jgi:hypothetical protein